MATQQRQLWPAVHTSVKCWLEQLLKVQLPQQSQGASFSATHVKRALGHLLHLGAKARQGLNAPSGSPVPGAPADVS